MKYKNYKSAIHNFTHSFISIDYAKSGRLAINVLIDLYKMDIENKATFDFINRTIIPTEADSKESRQLMYDYINWLSDHFESHSCNLEKLENLEITYWTDFNKAITPRGMKDIIEFEVEALVKWKAEGSDEHIIEITKTELINKSFLTLRIPEMS